MDLPPHLNWSRFWMFQTAVGRVAQYTCHYLEFYHMESQARTAGLLHDLGKLILLQLHPMGFRAILEYAHEHQVPLSTTEKLFLGCTSYEIGARFATRGQLSPHYINVMRWIDTPEAATEDACLVAIVSLSRDLCRHLDVGAAGDPVLENPLPLNETPEWRVLSDRLFPSFNLREFELQVHGFCQQMRLEFSGKPGRYDVESALR
jgi:HD-like signal output (HDOD) protein